MRVVWGGLNGAGLNGVRTGEQHAGGGESKLRELEERGRAPVGPLTYRWAEQHLGSCLEVRRGGGLLAVRALVPGVLRIHARRGSAREASGGRASGVARTNLAPVDSGRRPGKAREQPSALCVLISVAPLALGPTRGVGPEAGTVCVCFGNFNLACQLVKGGRAPPTYVVCLLLSLFRVCELRFTRPVKKPDYQ